ncbi:MAG: Gfo/Idh/MocA family oxidoreductase [Phycisphaerae bacterium]|jgi:hypothetical protein
MQDERRSSRRRFLKNAATAAGATLLASSLQGCASGRGERFMPQGLHRGVLLPRREKLRVAFIGTGGIGGYHLDSTAELPVVCPCYCDVDTRRMEKAAELHPQAKAYQDYREMFDKEHMNFDAVMVGVPDHHHYPATMIAMQLGKHVYTQKPLTHTVWEARQLTEAARKYQVATQMGNQGHSMQGWRLVFEWVHSGAIGDVLETHTWTNRPVWPQAMIRPEETDAVPEQLNWDAWLGPAPERAFKDKIYHPFVWRGWFDFGCGALGDMACHTMDGIFAVLDPGSPTSVEPIAATPLTAEAFPNSSLIKWEFPARKGRRAFTTYWYDGGLKPRLPDHLEQGRTLPDTGNLFIGTKASMLISGDYLESPRIIPESRMKEVGKPPKMLERSPGQIEEWILAATGEKPLDYTGSNFGYAGPFTEAVLLGNVALRVGRPLKWDGPNMRITNLPEANEFLTKEYRPGWKF